MTDATAKPVEFHILWGNTIDPEDAPSSYVFPTDAEGAAFWRGVAEADGAMEMQEVPGPDLRVNKDGEIVDRKVKTPTVIKPNSRFVLWCAHPEAGATPGTFEFASKEEGDAFILGASEMVGWTGYQVVPSADYRLVDDRAPDHFSAIGKLAAEALLQSENYAGDNVFMEPNGAYVQEGWSIGGFVNDFVPKLDKELREMYSVGLEDAGVDGPLLARMMDDHEGQPSEAARWYGGEYGLARTEEVSPRRPKV